MGCGLDKVVKAINKVASEVRDSRATNQLNELKNDLNKFATSMETAKPARDFSRLKSVMSNVEVKATATNVARPEFDKLPFYKDGQKTMTYAGIGSRETPIDIQKEMYRIGKELESLGYIGQSGGATGADKAFEGVNQPWEKEDGTVAGTKEFTKSKANVTRWAQYGKGRNSPTNVVVFKATDSNDTVRKIAKEIHPKKQDLSEKDGLNLHARNTFQVFGKNLDTPVDFVLFYAEEQKGLIRPKGGTGQAVEMARLKGIPTINMANSDWKEQLAKVVSSKGDIGKEEGLSGTTLVGESTVNSKKKEDIIVKKLVEYKHLSRYKNNSSIAKSIEKIIDAYDTAEFSNVVTTRDGEAKRRALWFGEEVYEYSGKRHEATAMHPYVIKIARDIEKEIGMPVGYFNSVLINEYKGGKGLKAHRDNESIFIDKDNNIGEIASLTLSGEGKVTIYDNKGKEVESHKVNAGDLYVMPGKQFQNNFRHKVDTVGKDTRISLTFRHIPNNDITIEVQSKKEVQLPEAKEGLTRGQTKAYDELSEVLTSATDHTYLLEGPGGTGKSFVIGKVLEKYVEDTNGAMPTIVGSAVAHAAKDVLGDFIEDSLGEDANAKFKRNVALQLGKVIDSHTNSRDTNPLIIVLDEVSMVDSISINMLLQKVEFANSVGKTTKIVLLGDRAQLRPIMTTDKFKVEYMSIPGGEDYYYVSINSINYVLNNSKTGLVGIDNSIVSGNVVNGEFVIDTDKFSKLKLKSSIFMNNLRGTTLLENMRNPELAKVFDKFRTGDDVIETSKQAEDQNKYKLQYANGIKALKEAKNSKGDNLTVDLSIEQLPNDVFKSWINGSTSVVAYKNDTIRDINDRMTKIAAYSKGEKATMQVHKYGVFTGQAYRSTVNMLTPGMPTTKTTNNTLAVVTDVGNANEKLHNGAVEVSKGQSTMLYEGSSVLDLARSSFREDPDNLYVYGLRLNMEKIPTAIKEKITIGTVRYPKAGEPGVFVEIAGILGYTGNVNVTKLVKEYGEVVQYMYVEGDPTEVDMYSLSNLNYKAFEGIASAEFDIESFRPTFAMTVHKSQGQTLENVIVVEEWSNWSAMSAVNKLESMYVAVSRSKTKVVLAGSSHDRLMNIAESKKKDAIIAPINSQTARDIQGCNK